ncbi:type VI secretion system-associated protein TagO [Proteus mirabilis]|nr:type VI secretion system-associated protein TagO [Proteus mirabilis]
MTYSRPVYFIFLALFSISHVFAQEQENKTNHTELALFECREETSQLIRLSCYDQINIGNKPVSIVDVSAMGNIWRLAVEHEMKRENHTAGFMVTVHNKGTYPVIMTIPAMGYLPLRPILMLSCIDNITRMQIALAKKQTAGNILLITDKTQLSSEWFLREDGYLLEASRGLSGIDEIKQLLSSTKLTIKLANDEQLTFNISGINEEIKPLRSACHW